MIPFAYFEQQVMLLGSGGRFVSEQNRELLLFYRQLN